MKAPFTIYLKNENFFEGELPVVNEVCWRCEGSGSHVNPAVDGNGLSREDFDDDPDFKENYLAGVYDVPCYECHGKRVVAEPDYSQGPADFAAAHRLQLCEDADDLACERAEMGMRA